MSVRVAPSILSADFGYLARDIAAAERGGADLIHVDVMDGHFVPNLTMGPPLVKSLRKVTELPLDCHLMIERPGDYGNVKGLIGHPVPVAAAVGGREHHESQPAQGEQGKR